MGLFKKRIIYLEVPDLAPPPLGPEAERRISEQVHRFVAEQLMRRLIPNGKDACAKP